jgi:hypothetical protein
VQVTWSVRCVRMALALASETSQIHYISERDPALAPCVPLVCALSEPRDPRPRAFDPTLASATNPASFGSTSTATRRRALASSPSPSPPHRSPSSSSPQKPALHPRSRAIDALLRTAKSSYSPHPKIYDRPPTFRPSSSADVESPRAHRYT